MKPKTFNMDRAKRAHEVIMTLVASGAPMPFWCAIRMEDGKTHGAAYPTKAAAMAHCADPNHFTYMVIMHPMDVPNLSEIISFMRYSEMKEAYWRTQEDAHLHMPKGAINPGNASAYGV